MLQTLYLQTSKVGNWPIALVNPMLSSEILPIVSTVHLWPFQSKRQVNTLLFYSGILHGISASMFSMSMLGNFSNNQLK